MAECTGHTDLAGEFRQLSGTALDRLEVWLDHVAQRAAAGAASSEQPEPTPASCAVCPVCAVLALIRGERSELAVRLAEHAGGLLTVMRTALDEGGTAHAAASPEPPGRSETAHSQPAGRRVVQHITVVRSDRPPPGTDPST